MIELYDRLINAMAVMKPDVLLGYCGRDTEFEAIYRVEADSETGEWIGFLVFKDERFSPPDPDVPGVQFRHRTPPAACGSLAVERAEATWQTLVAIFKALMKGG